MVQTFFPAEGVCLRCFQDSRFKQSCLSVQLIRPMDKKEAACNALLPAVLLRGTESAPDLRDITLRLDELYGAAVGTLVRRVGDLHTTGLYCSFMEDKYALNGDKVFAPMVDFLRELLRQPVLENGVFRKDYVESEKRNLISAMESERNDKRTYASLQLLRRTCQNDSYGIPRLGDKDSVAAITPESLYTHYQKILRESQIHLFYVGSQAPSEVASLLASLFSGLERAVTPLPPQSGFAGGDPLFQTEQLEVSQARLAMAFTSPITVRDPGFVAMQVCSTVFGGGMTGKLFMEVREKQSLCYEIGAGYHGSKGILEVYAGVDENKLKAVQVEAERLLEDCRQGNITETELENAKQALVSSLLSVHDSPGSIERFYATAALSGLSLSPEEYQEQAKRITVQQVMEAAKTLRLQTVYCLKGAS